MQIKTNRGFTLIELMIVVAVIGILSAAGLLSFYTWQPGMNLRKANRDLFSATMRAKGEAVKRNINCALTLNQVVAGVPQVYIVYADMNQNFQFDAGEPVITQERTWPRYVALSGNSFPVDNAGNPSIFFKPNGIPTQAAGGSANGTIILNNNNNRSRSVIVSRVGNVSMN